MSDHSFVYYERISASLDPILWGLTRIVLSKVLGHHLWGMELIKIDGALVFIVLEKNPKIWGCDRTVKIGL